jgi:hypothetical protein
VSGSVVACFSSQPNPAFERDSPRSGRAPQFNVGRHTHKLTMKTIITFVRVLILSLTQCGSSFAQQQVQIPTHCTAGEFAYLNANLSKIHYFPKPGGGWKKGDTIYELRKTGKVLSICADVNMEPFQSVAYRYGSIGNVEMERIATRSDKFSIFSRSTSPHTGENLMFFNAGQYVYCVSEATAQGSGIRLTVLKSGRQILNLFSGNGFGIDFESEMIQIDFDTARSPTFQHVEPLNNFQTACDPRPAQ